MSDYIIAAFYKFVRLKDYPAMREPLIAVCCRLALKGTILLADEGINGTIAGLRQSIDAFFDYIKSDSRLADLEHKEAVHHEPPFQRMKVRLKQEIVRLGMANIDPAERVGAYVSPKAWNRLISEPDVLLIDVRNDYEIEAGSFQGAINPATRSFGQFPEFVETQLSSFKDRKVAMFCTGGIRCEKASSFMLSLGFQHVYHLRGRNPQIS